MDLSIVVPVYSGEKTLEELNRKILDHCSKENYSYEVIYVYDCGLDKSLEILRKLKGQYPEHVKVIELTRNYGQHNAIIAGFSHCTGDFIVTMDEDLQHQPKDISNLFQEQQKGGYDIVYGFYDSLNHSGFRNVTSRVLKKVLSLSINDLHEDYTAFRLIKKEIALATINMRNSYTFLDGYLSWISINIGSTKVEHKERFAGESSYTLKKLIEHSLNIVFTFSNLPIRFLSYTSIGLFGLTVLYIVYIVLRKLLYNDLAEGFPTLIISIGLGVSLILLGLGVIGEYLYRINLKTTKRPNYIIKN